MRNLDIATLRSLQAVAEYGAVTRAAESLNMTQSALSMQMKRLEETFGQPMLVKQGRGVALSDFGIDLLSEARKLVAYNDAIVARFTGDRPDAKLRLGLTTDWMFDRVARAVRNFKHANPKVDLVINDARSVDLRQQLKRGEHDLILVTEFDSPPGAIHLAKAELAWVGAPGGTAWKERPLPIANSPSCAYYAVGMESLTRAGIEWRMSMGEGGRDTWHVLAAADLGITMMPRGRCESGLEAINHGGALPPLPPTWLNIYIGDGPVRTIAAEFTGYLRDAVCGVAEAA